MAAATPAFRKEEAAEQSAAMAQQKAARSATMETSSITMAAPRSASRRVEGGVAVVHARRSVAMASSSGASSATMGTAQAVMDAQVGVLMKYLQVAATAPWIRVKSAIPAHSIVPQQQMPVA